MKDKKKIVITGASGFLGSNLLKKLSEDDSWCIYAMSSRPEQLRGKLPSSDITYCSNDIIQTEDAQSVFSEAIVVHCAFPRNTTGIGMAEGMKFIQCLFETAVDNNAKAIIHISSQSVYSSERSEPATENTEICLDNSYAVGKYATELLLESICKGTNTIYTHLRIASLIGPGFDQRIVNRLVKQALQSGEITVRENQQRFGFFDIEDVTSAIVKMIHYDPQLYKKTYNVGTSDSYSLIEIAKNIQGAVKERTDAEVLLHMVKGQEVSNTSLNCQAFYNDFDYYPAYSLRKSVNAILDYDIRKKMIYKS